ncbi:vesicle coat component [Sporothrix curviconia]|uniref:Protein transport protein sec16 n=1 Tax=Sporothrix curviconia TaxID=1260050 RepID=A0ABP0BXJ5_9PEZI
MASGEPNAAWHPAFMPHQSPAQAPPTTSSTAAQPSAAWHPALMPQAAAASPLVEAVAQEQEHEPASSLSLDLSHDVHDAHDPHDDTGVDAWFPEYDAGSPWTEQAPADVLSSEAAPEPTPELARAATPEPAREALPESTPDKPAEPSTASTPVASPPVDETASKHFSTISFTRTVANDVNWDAEEDDAEWSISRIDTDPFQFMPPSDRSNSFPVVPPPQTDAEQPEAPYEQQPLASTQAMDIVQEVDNEVSAEQATPEHSAQHADEGLDAWGLTSENGEDPEDSSFFAGTAGTEQQAQELETAAWEEPETPDARFEEGVPLIPHKASAEASIEAAVAPVEEAQRTQETAPPAVADPFAETTDDGEDDFFNNAGTAAEPEPQPETETARSPAPPAFERKSTMQVLQSMNVDNVEEEEDSFFASKIDNGPITEEPEPTEAAPEITDKPNGTATDLADQWAALLDDEDGLLLEDSPPEAEAETKELDPAAFFGDDDEGFLEDDAEEPTGEPIVPQEQGQEQQQQQQQQQQSAATANRYLPQASPAQAQQPQRQANPYLPSASFPAAQTPVIPSPYSAPGPAPSQFPVAYGYGAAAAQQTPPPQQDDRPTLRKAQSFADKSKGGYSSPYDLPMDIVKQPRKRQSMQQMHQSPGAQSAPPQGPPPRSSSMQAYSPTSSAVPPPPANHAMPPPPIPAQTTAPAANKPVQPVRSDSFFEDLPVLPKVRPASRHSLPSPSQTSPYAAPPPQTPTIPPYPPQGQAPPPRNASPYTPAPVQPQTPSVPPPSGHYAPPVATGHAPAPPPQPAAQTHSSALGGLVAPPRANPYATLQSVPPALGAPGTSPPAAGSMRYSPSPNQLPPPSTGALPSRYSPAPPARVPSAGYAPAATPPILAHQPRTSSPLAHFEMSYEKPRASSIAHQVTTLADAPHTTERRSSSSIFESRLNRVPSLPPTREEEEEPSLPQQRPVSSGTGAQQQQYSPAPMSQSSQTSQYSPRKPRQTPPPQQQQQQQQQGNAYSQATLSPPKRILNYTPQNEIQQSPPRRSQTQSPGALYGGNRPVHRTVDPIPRPSSVHEAAPPPARPRAASQNLNLVPPTDGSETDPLQRWKGTPIFAWGVGGTFVSSFPQDVPRYGMNHALPMIHRAAGEVLVKNIKEIQTLDERQAKFPGPLKGKSKKKEVLTWLAAGIESLERSLPSSSFAMQVSLEDKRLEERVLLWKILHLFIEHDGVLEGNPAVEKAVRAILSPDAGDAAAAVAAAPLGDASTGYPGFQGASSHLVQADAVDSTVIEQIRKNLLLGDKEKVVWDAVDKRLWGHAFLIAGAASRELFKKVAQEFVRKEVNTPGLQNEPLAALYEVLSGNHEECVDELVPVHARAGLHLMTTTTTTTQVSNANGGTQTKDEDELAGLDKWRETLSLILSNRSADDVQAINSLGDLLSGYGRAEAAHVCFLFSRSAAVFGGLDDPAANVVLLGADHKRQADSFAKETDAVLLSEVYEYGLSLSGGSNLNAANSPHLAAYKLQHAMVLAEYGLRDKALQYCEAIVSAMSAQTRRSPYYHPLLESAVEDLMKRLKQAPKEESNSWIPKPSMNKVSDTVWNRFNKFVAGDDNEGSGAGADGEAGGEIGPFSKIAGGTPTISRPPSAGGGGIGATGMEMFGGQNLVTSPSYGNLSSSLNGGLGLTGGLTGSASMNNLPTMPPTRAASRYAPGAAVSQPIPIPSAPGATGGLASPPVIHNSFDGHSMHSGYAPLGVPPGAVLPSSAPSFSPYEPAANASPAYAASPSRRVSSDQSVSGDAIHTQSQLHSQSHSQLHPQPQPTLRRQASELSLGYSPYTPAPNAGQRPSLSRKSSYAPLSQAEPTPPVPPTESATPYNPYAPSDAGVNGSASPYAPVATSEPAAEPTPKLLSAPKEEEEEVATAQAEPEAAPSYGYQAPSYGYEPPSMNTSFEPVSDEPATKADSVAEDAAGGQLNGNANGYSGGGGGYEPPSFQPYSYEPPSYEPDADAEGDDAGENGDAAAPPKAKSKSFMDDDDDDGFAPAVAKPAGKSREEKDRENAELVRKIAEDEAKRAAAEKEAKAKKGWGITSWWGKKDTGGLGAGGSGSGSGGSGEPPKAVRANLGEKSSFYFDPELKRWIDKNASPEDQAAKSTPPPPPPRSNPHSASSTPAPPPSGMGFGAPPPPASAGIVPPAPSGSAPPTVPPAMARTASAASSGPPSRPATSMGDATSIDDLLGSVPAGPRKAGAKKGRKSGRYVDVMAK